MDSYLESVASQVFPKSLRNLIGPFRDEIEGGAKTKVPFKLHQLCATTQALWPLNIVRQNNSELLVVGPTRPIRRRDFRTLQNRPCLFGQDSPAAAIPLPERQSHPGSDPRLDRVIELVAKQPH